MVSGVQVINSSQNKITHTTMSVEPAVFGLSISLTISTFNLKQCMKDTMKLIF